VLALRAKWRRIDCGALSYGRVGTRKQEQFRGGERLSKWDGGVSALAQSRAICKKPQSKSAASADFENAAELSFVWIRGGWMAPNPSVQLSEKSGDSPAEPVASFRMIPFSAIAFC
jgi:hypothetical protein